MSASSVLPVTSAHEPPLGTAVIGRLAASPSRTSAAARSGSSPPSGRGGSRNGGRPRMRTRAASCSVIMARSASSRRHENHKEAPASQGPLFLLPWVPPTPPEPPPPTVFSPSGMSPVLPFLMVVALQLGIPVSVQGTIYATSLLLTVLGKPLIAALADCFPSFRKAIFLVVITIMVMSYSCVRFIPPMKDPPVLRGRFVLAPAGHLGKPSASPSPASGSLSVSPSSLALTSGSQVESGQEVKGERPMLVTQDDGGCFIAMSWDCIATCTQPWACLNSNMTSGTDLKATHVPSDLGDAAEDGGEAEGVASEGSWLLTTPNARFYRLEGADVPPVELVDVNITLECTGGEWEGDACISAWSYAEFWLYFLLLIVGQLCFNTANSITDAIAVDSVGESGG
ncbi:uncharacterized protein LOC134787627, partial [Penaeus indicus]|uniref:uncharacterized protein LOC134787627 n=1 Tax=Penaeus indicus TaxID=29960 RepID=UPI00300C0396